MLKLVIGHHWPLSRMIGIHKTDYECYEEIFPTLTHLSYFLHFDLLNFKFCNYLEFIQQLIKQVNLGQ